MGIDWKFIRVVDTETELLELILMTHNYATQAGLDLRSRVYSTGKVRIFEGVTGGSRVLMFEAEKRLSYPPDREEYYWLIRSNLELPPE